VKDGFHNAIVITWVLTGLCLLIFGILYLLSLAGIDWSDKYFFLVFSFPLFLFCIFLLPLLYSMRNKYKTDLGSFRDGKFLVHWLYEPDEWGRFNWGEWRKARKRSIIIPIGFILAFFVLGIVSGRLSEDEMRIVAPWIIAFGLGISVLMLVYTYVLYRRSTTCPQETYIGFDGVSFGGYYTSWKVVGSRLGRVRVVSGDPSVLEFEIMVWGRYGSTPRPLRIPVPRGHEREGEELVKKFL
jgi:hypothetical protein